jgi:hypothetical protein
MAVVGTGRLTCANSLAAADTDRPRLVVLPHFLPHASAVSRAEAPAGFEIMEQLLEHTSGRTGQSNSFQ